MVTLGSSSPLIPEAPCSPVSPSLAQPFPAKSPVVDVASCHFSHPYSRAVVRHWPWWDHRCQAGSKVEEIIESFRLEKTLGMIKSKH